MRITALLFKRVGDSLLATPAIRAVKQGFSACELTIICEEQVARVFQYNPQIDQIKSISHSASFFELLAAVRESRPDFTLDFLSNPRSATASLFSGAKQRVGIGYGIRRLAFTHVVAVQNRSAPLYSADHKRGLAQALGCDSSNKCDFVLADHERAFASKLWSENCLEQKKVMALFVNSRRTYKRWPIERFAELIQWCRSDTDWVPLILQTPGDENQIHSLMSLIGASIPIVAQVSNLGELGAVMERSQLLVGNDGGPKHIAVALGTPTLTLFGSDPPAYWTPPDDPRHRVVTSHGGSQRHSNSLENVSVQTVIHALKDMSNSL